MARLASCSLQEIPLPNTSSTRLSSEWLAERRAFGRARSLAWRAPIGTTPSGTTETQTGLGWSFRRRCPGPGRRWMDALIEVLRDALLQADAGDAGGLTGSGLAGNSATSPAGAGSKGPSKWGAARARVVGRVQSFKFGT